MLLEFELDIVKEKVNQKADIRAKLDLFMDENNVEISEKYPTVQKRIFEINEAIIDLINYKRELYEAQEVANKIRNVMNSMLRHLAFAKEYDNWGHFYVEKIEGKKKKAAYMDKAFQDSHQVCTFKIIFMKV